MKVAVFSDTHGVTTPMVRAIRQVRPDALVHLGDYERDTAVLLKEFPELPLYYQMPAVYPRKRRRCFPPPQMSLLYPVQHYCIVNTSTSLTLIILVIIKLYL